MRADLVAPAVEAHGLVKVFGVTPALVGVDLLAPRGSVCGLVGGNGAGKTTLLRCVATALRPTLGHVAVLGVDAVRRPADVRPLVDLVATAGGAYLDMSGVENLRFALAMRGTDASDGDVARAFARAGLERAATNRARTYSSGMLRRLALARVLLTRPPVLLLDEPYAALDEAGRELVDAILIETRADGRTALVATHDRQRVAALADAVVRLERGAVVPTPSQQPAASAGGAR